MIAIFGGSFDPIHFGHLHNADCVQKQLQFDHFFFLPCGDPAHKNQLLFNQQQRLKMLELALKDSSDFQINLTEFSGRASYTIDTLRYFKKKYHKICFIMGSDSFQDLANWEDYQQFASLTNIVVLNRGDKITNLHGFTVSTDLDEFKNSNAKLYFFNNDLINISSTLIRSKIQQHKNLMRFLPMTVINYINESTKLQQIKESLVDLKVENIQYFASQNEFDEAEEFIVATARSHTHLKATANNIKAEAKRIDLMVLGYEGLDTNWAIIDMIFVVVHIMTKEAREFYNLDKLFIYD